MESSYEPAPRPPAAAIPRRGLAAGLRRARALAAAVAVWLVAVGAAAQGEGGDDAPERATGEAAEAAGRAPEASGTGERDATGTTGAGTGAEEGARTGTTGVATAGTANGTAANGTAANGTAANGTAANGTAANGTAANGTVANGTAANGTAANGTAANGTAANGTAANGTAANGTAANGTAANGTAANGIEARDAGGSGTAASGGRDGSASPAGADFSDAQAFLGRRQVWDLDDPLGPDDIPWDDFDPVADYTPRGLVHLGPQLRVAALPGGGAPTLDGPLLELGLVFDVRYGERSPWHLRAVAAVAYQPHDEVNLGAGTTVASSPLSFRFRLLPLAIDIGNWLAVRAGGEIGGQWLPTPLSDAGEMTWFGGGSAELVLKLMGSRLELGIFSGLQLTAVSRLSREGYSTGVVAEGVIGVSAGYLLF